MFQFLPLRISQLGTSVNSHNCRRRFLETIERGRTRIAWPKRGYARDRGRAMTLEISFQLVLTLIKRSRGPVHRVNRRRVVRFVAQNRNVTRFGRLKDTSTAFISIDPRRSNLIYLTCLLITNTGSPWLLYVTRMLYYVCVCVCVFVCTYMCVRMWLILRWWKHQDFHSRLTANFSISSRQLPFPSHSSVLSNFREWTDVLSRRIETYFVVRLAFVCVFLWCPFLFVVPLASAQECTRIGKKRRRRRRREKKNVTCHFVRSAVSSSYIRNDNDN